MKVGLILATSLFSVCTGFSVPKCSNLYTSPSRVGRHSHPRGRRSSVLFSAISSNGELLPGIVAINEANDEISAKLEYLRQTPYFRLYSVDILASCEYMPQELFECYSETCEVYPIDEEDVPEDIKSTDMDEQEFELDGWGRWDMPSNDYYDIEQFPEGYTGYDGSMIWGFIHEKICFQGYEYDDNHWKADFNKAVSGLHSVVSAQIVSGIQDRVVSGEGFTDDEIWRDPKIEFARRLGIYGETPLAIENLYFAYMLLLSAVSRAKDRLLADCQSGKIDTYTASVLAEVLSLPLLDNPSVGIAAKKLHDHAVESTNNLWEARMRSRELLRIMNCVQCNKCRLHGKIAMMGLSTALQINLGRNGEGEDPNRIHRVELAALITTLYKFSRAVNFCQAMK